MIRAPLGDQKWWDKWTDYRIHNLQKEWKRISEPSKNPGYRPQYILDTSFEQLRVLLTCYSRGDAIIDLPQYFNGLLDAWELSDKLADELKAGLKPGQGWDHRELLTSPIVSDDTRAHNDPRSWIFDLKNLNHYNWCFWLVGLALLLEIEDDLWQRLLKLINAQGEDILLDKVIATRQIDRKIGDKLLHKKPYARLLKAIDAPKEKQAKLLFEFVDGWYKELERKGNDQLWWYNFGDPVKHPLTKGSYFGRWCIEGAVCAKAFDIDDNLCLKHPYYPKAFLHEEESVKRGILQKLKSLFF